MNTATNNTNPPPAGLYAKVERALEKFGKLKTDADAKLHDLSESLRHQLFYDALPQTIQQKEAALTALFADSNAFQQAQQNLANTPDDADLEAKINAYTALEQKIVELKQDLAAYQLDPETGLIPSNALQIQLDQARREADMYEKLIQTLLEIFKGQARMISEIASRF